MWSSQRTVQQPAVITLTRTLTLTLTLTSAPWSSLPSKARCLPATGCDT